MRIILDKVNLKLFAENYSEYEESDVISVLSDVCQIIDKNKIAKFYIAFSAWDSKFSNVDFAYDFTSIASELDLLLNFLKSNEGSFLLHFYELDRKIKFIFINKELVFQIFPSIGDNILSHGIIEACELKEQVVKLLESFKKILINYFPEALNIFIKANFLFPPSEPER